MDMGPTWETVESGPRDAARTVLLLPGGACSARSYAELMAEPTLAGVRLVAVTMPGMAGAPPQQDSSPEAYARSTAEVLSDVGADVVVGFSMGAVVAFELVVSGAFTGPVVLLAVSLSSPDEPGFFRGLVRLGAVLGTFPFAVMKKGLGSMANKAPLSEERKAELRADFELNTPSAMRAALLEYVRWLSRDNDRAQRFADAVTNAWVVHAEKGDGGLTSHERSVLEACPRVRVVTVPGSVFFLPNEVPGQIADIVLEALAEV
jgi:pimeloyl-ACP methyl ester carboxylesterase